MSYSPNLLKILGTSMAAELIKNTKSPEQRLFQAIILQGFEDALTNQTGKQESYFKKDAHDWIINGNEEFEQICWYAGFDPVIVTERYKKLIENGTIKFSHRQVQWIKYRDLYKKYRAAKTQGERRNIMLKIVKVNLGRNSS